MKRKIAVINFKNIQTLMALAFVAVTFSAHANEADDAMAERNKALRQQHSRVQELMQKQNTASSSTASGSASASLRRGGSSAAVAQSANGMGVIKLSSKPATNQQLREGMNTARTSLQRIKAAKKNVTEQELQRSQVNVALEQAVQAYIACREEANVPIRANYERDTYLRDMIAIKQSLTQKNLDAAAVNAMLDRLAAARATLVVLTEATQ
jgi:hypothetical protein